jgi:hypothetical protein
MTTSDPIDEHTDLLDVADDVLPAGWYEYESAKYDVAMKGQRVIAEGRLSDVEWSYFLTLSGATWRGEVHFGDIIVAANEVTLAGRYDPTDPDKFRDVAINLRDRSRKAIDSMLDGLESVRESLGQDD